MLEEYKLMTGEDLSGLSRHEQMQMMLGDIADELNKEMEKNDVLYEGKMVSEEEFLNAVNDTGGIGKNFENAEEFIEELQEAYYTDTFAYCILYDRYYQGEMPIVLGYYEDTGKWIPLMPSGW